MFPSALVFALVAAIPTFLIAWMTSGYWTPAHVSWTSVILMLPMIVSVKLGIDQGYALLATYCFCWLIAFAIIARYIHATKVQTKLFEGQD